MENFFIDKLGNDCDDGEDKPAADEFNGVDDFLTGGKLDLFNELPGKPEYNESKPKQKSVFTTDNTYLITSYKDKKNDESFSPNLSNILKKSSIQPGLERRNRVPAEKSKRALKLKRKKFAAKTKGKNWFHMRAPEVTEEIKTDFELLKMRSVLDKKHVYKKNDITSIPKHFQIGKIIENPADFYGGRIPKSQRKKTMVEELLADAEFKNYQKKKFKEIMDENRRRKHPKKKLEQGKMHQKGKSKR